MRPKVIYPCRLVLSFTYHAVSTYFPSVCLFPSLFHFLSSIALPPGTKWYVRVRFLGAWNLDFFFFCMQTLGVGMLSWSFGEDNDPGLFLLYSDSHGSVGLSNFPISCMSLQTSAEFSSSMMRKIHICEVSISLLLLFQCKGVVDPRALSYSYKTY